eukprot:4379601-Karenia_brevis.AAC.1
MKATHRFDEGNLAIVNLPLTDFSVRLHSLVAEHLREAFFKSGVEGALQLSQHESAAEPKMGGPALLASSAIPECVSEPTKMGDPALS